MDTEEEYKISLMVLGEFGSKGLVPTLGPQKDHWETFIGDSGDSPPGGGGKPQDRLNHSPGASSTWKLSPGPTRPQMNNFGTFETSSDIRESLRFEEEGGNKDGFLSISSCSLVVNPNSSEFFFSIDFLVVLESSLLH